MNFFDLGIGILIGAFGIIVVSKVSVNTKRWFINKTRLIQQYWIAVCIFVILSVIMYSIVLIVFPQPQLEVAITLANQVSSLSFAIFVGYFAFAQVMEGRKEKFDSLALESWRKNPPQLPDAKSYFAQAHAIDPKDYKTLANYCELLLIMKDYKTLEDRLLLLNKLAKNEKNIVYLYLSAGKEIFKGRLDEANDSIKKLIDYTSRNPDYLENHIWFYVDLKDSSAYKSLKGERKKLFDNLILFLEKKMPDDKRALYVSGDYSIDTLDNS